MLGGYIASRLLCRNIPVPVLAGRDADCVIMFLAVLCSGNFYVALDPDMPAKKLSGILDEIRPELVLLSGDFNDALKKAEYTGQIITPDFWDGKAASCEFEDYDIQTDAPAYMVYTSGSTGKPKGVVKSQGAVISFIEAFTEQFGLNETDVIGNQTPFFFDASAKDIYQMIKTGARLEIIPPEHFVLPPNLIKYMNEREINYICWVPSALSVVAQLGTFKKFLPDKLKKVFFVGEVFPMKYLKIWRESLPEVTFVNLYGQTEISGICCYQVVDDECMEMDSLPMGEPLPNCKIYLMAEGADIPKKLSEAASGETGELYIAGPSLADGYFKDEEKTALAFKKLEIPGEGKARVFKTGDMVRLDEKGRLVFAARSDSQIKHMGYRIELGEIEAVASKLPEIAKCCCLYDNNKDKILLFVQRAEGCEVAPKEIRSKLKSMLSSYMLPAKVILAEPMPMLANGKTDRQALRQLI